MKIENIIAPDRVLFHNLLDMVNRHYTDEELVDKANELAGRAIREEIDLVKRHVDNGILLPRDFKKFALNDVINYEKLEAGGTKHFFLIKCLSRIKKCSNHIESPQWSEGDVMQRESGDKSGDIINKFDYAITQLLENDRAALFSSKTLGRLKQPCGRGFEGDQLAVIEFLIEEVFPFVFPNDLAEEIVSQTWEKSVLYIGDNQVLSLDDKDSASARISEKYQTLCSALSKEENCGPAMATFFHEVRKLHSKKKFIPINVSEAIKKSEIQVKPTQPIVTYEETPIGYTDEKLSQQIMIFARWLPIIVDDEQGETAKEAEARLDAVASVIETVRNSFISSITQPSYRALSWGDNNSGGYFAMAGFPLRQELIRAMTKEKYFCEQFKKNYAVSC